MEVALTNLCAILKKIVTAAREFIVRRQVILMVRDNSNQIALNLQTTGKWLYCEMNSLHKYFTSHTWDCVLDPTGFGDFLNIPLKIPPASWNKHYMEMACKF